MAKKRNTTSEILAKRDRLYRRRSIQQQIAERIKLLQAAFAAIQKTDKVAREELLRYFPIGLVAVIEFFFRDMVRGFIDEGAADIGRVRKFVEKVEIETAFDIGRRKLTIGDYIAHRIPLNSLDDINIVMSALLEKDFLGEIKKAQHTGMQVFGDKHVKAVITLFEVRHIFCHELASKHQIKAGEVTSFMASVRQFFAATEMYIYAEDYPGSLGWSFL